MGDTQERLGPETGKRGNNDSNLVRKTADRSGPTECNWKILESRPKNVALTEFLLF